jgi:transposase-like protein
VEEALIEMYLAGVSVRRVDQIAKALWGRSIRAHPQSLDS